MAPPLKSTKFKSVKEAGKALKELASKLDKFPTKNDFNAEYGRNWEMTWNLAQIYEASGLKKPNATDRNMEEYIEIARQIGRRPRVVELTENLQKRLYRTVGDLKAVDILARKLAPDLYATRLQINETRPPRSFGRKFIVTTFVGSTQLHEQFWQSLNQYAEHLDAKIIVLACADPAHTKTQDLGDFDPRISKGRSYVLTGEASVGEKLHLSGGLRIGAKQIDPTTGTERLAQRNRSFFFGAPKQRLRFVPTRRGKHPYALGTTGACTVPDYKTDLYLSGRTAYLAASDHTLGAVIFEKLANGDFYFRHIQAGADGCFYDLWNYVTPEGVEKSPGVEALVFGDWHTGLTDPDVEKASFKMIELLKPDKVFHHDFMDSSSISHHDLKKLVTRARKAVKADDRYHPFGRDLEAELTANAKGLERFVSTGVQVYHADSNHPRHLDRWLESGEFLKDDLNLVTAVPLLEELAKGGVPYHRAMKDRIDPDAMKSIHLLTNDESHVIHGIEHAVHGHIGVHGARGSIKSLERAYRAITFGHVHAPEILREAWCVGTSTHLELEYNLGPGSWVNANSITHRNGSRQLLLILDGKWTSLK